MHAVEAHEACFTGIACVTSLFKRSSYMPMDLDSRQRNLWFEKMRFVTANLRYGWRTVVPLNIPMNTSKPLYAWLYSDATEYPTELNCMEAILVAGFYAGLWNKGYIEQAMTSVGSGNTVGYTKLGSYMKTKVSSSTDETIQSGMIVMMGEFGEHYFLALGSGKALELDKGSAGEVEIEDIKSRHWSNPIQCFAPPPTMADLLAIPGVPDSGSSPGLG